MKKVGICLMLVLGSFVFAQKSQTSDVIHHYIALKDALVGDNAVKATAIAKNMEKNLATYQGKELNASQLNSLQKATAAIAQSKDIATQRKNFYTISDNVAEMAKKTTTHSTTYYVQYCPMAKGQWLSKEKEIKNPYYGKSMLSCGSVKSEIK
ncbi:DUF3347 domain-containing protein [Elizabethkingia sp. JS20170427COW]|uniref:DUF3347 domain-containing protein n=1 Tax=Elizabethkingia sp. JS20170427COW TaxID=2583851 RepID=UPI0011107F3A|nr:DUF3347 domain-containing protein [Elizabethkingia sp. JS20170427COW]QCX53591.1 DUF3347 domain-containing protein [Elizabethkingia sp. JS20170427COW]